MYADDSSSSSDDSLNEGITGQTFSGINLCEIDSLENVFRDKRGDNNEQLSALALPKVLSYRNLYFEKLKESPSMNALLNNCDNNGLDSFQAPEFHQLDSELDDPCVSSKGDEEKEHGLKMRRDHDLLVKTMEKKPAPETNKKLDLVPKPTAMGPCENKHTLNNKTGNSLEERSSDRKIDFQIFESITPELVTEDEQELVFVENTEPSSLPAEEVFLDESMEEAHVPSISNSDEEYGDDEALQVKSSPREDPNTSDFSIINEDSDNAPQHCEHGVFHDDDEHEIPHNPEDNNTANEERLNPFNAPVDSPHKNFKVPDNCKSCVQMFKKHSDIFLDASQHVDHSPVPSKSSLKAKSSSVCACDDCDKRHNTTAVAIPKNNQLNENQAVESSDNAPCKYVENCTKVFHKLFQMHVSEPEVSVGHDSSVSQDTNSTNKLTSSISAIVSDPDVLSRLDPQTFIQDDLDSLNFKSIGKSKKAELQKIYVDIEVPTKDMDEDGHFKSRNILLEFPVREEDHSSAMLLVSNVFLNDPKIQFINSSTEISYYLPHEISTEQRYRIGSFKIRNVLTIPVAFKMNSVKILDITPRLGALLPSETLTIHVYSKFSSCDPSSVHRLKIEGILIYAAPFVFNVGFNPQDLSENDCEQFWTKFGSPGFLFAQTRFVSIQVYQNHQHLHQQQDQQDNSELLRLSSKGFSSRLWDLLRFINYSEFIPKSKPYTAFSKEVLRHKSLSPMGQMILRRRQSLALDVYEHAENLNDHRTKVTLGTALLLSLILWYALYASRARWGWAEEEKPRGGLQGWWNNLASWLYKMFVSPS